MIVSYKYRVKDSTTRRALERHARAVNTVWNYCCQVQREAQSRWKSGGRSWWPTAFDLIKLCTGASGELGLHSDTVQTTCRRFVAARNSQRKCPRFRASVGSKRSLGWVPFIPRALKIEGASAIYLRRRFRFWKSREMPERFKEGVFVQDARGRWYIVLYCEIADGDRPRGTGEIGIDLGLKNFATLSDGTAIKAPNIFRRHEAALARAQRAKRRDRMRAVHAKIVNSRRHFLHEASSRIAGANALIVVGRINAANLAQNRSRLGKSVFDAGWYTFRRMLEYKASRHRARYVEVNESYSSATCSACKARSGPQGIAGLQVRHWECSECGCSHERDVNAALNILSVGAERRPLAGEIRDATSVAADVNHPPR